MKNEKILAKINYPNTKMENRITRHKYFMQFAKFAAERSTCRVKVGAIAIKDNRIVMAGYNGSPSKMEHCIDIGCETERGHCIRTIHAEMNIITNAAKQGIALNHTLLYITHEPCFFCMKHIVNSGIIKVYYLNEYKDDRIPNQYYTKTKVLQLKEK